MVVTSVIFTPGGAAVGDDHSETVAGAGEACAVDLQREGRSRVPARSWR